MRSTRLRPFLTRASWLIAAIVAACTTTTDPEPVASLSLQPNLDSVEVGETYNRWVIILRDAAGDLLTGRTLAWESNNTAVATIDPGTGVVTAIAGGETLITARIDGQTATSTIRVLKPVISIVVTPDSFDLPLTTTKTIPVQLIGPGGVALTNRVITWFSSNSGVAVVSTNGLVTAVSQGTATITIAAGGLTKTVRVRVVAEPVTSVRILPQQSVHVVRLGQTVQLTAECLNAAQQVLSGRPITWNSGNPVVATVSQSGLVTGNAIGSAGITATCDGTANAQVTVQVTPVPVASVTITPNGLSITQGTQSQLTVVARDSANNVLPLQGRQVVWSSTNLPVASVSSQGVVSAVSAGTADVTVTVDGVSSTAVTIQVNAVPVATVTISPATLNLSVNATGQLVVTARDQSNNVLSLQGRTVIWSSDNLQVASVSTLGVVSGVGPGTTNVRVSVDGVVAQPATVNITPFFD